jgi:1-acyl-sn-glycerol-3-phosphate acyltransferase
MDTLKFLFAKNFRGLFMTQFLGAFNDNLFKNSVALMIVMLATNEVESGIWVNLAGALFIFPFVLFSPVAGQVADKYCKAKVLRYVKFAEIPIMCFAGLAFYLESNPLLVFTIFLMGAQSSFFGPAKYSILPQHLSAEKLTAGNGLISMSTFIAIITGLILATILVSKGLTGYIIFAVVGCALLGYLTSRYIPDAKPYGDNANNKVSFNFLKETKSLWNVSRENNAIFMAIVAISWLWFLGAVVLTQMPSVAKFVLGGNADLSTALTMMFVVGIASGALMCIKVSRGEVELGLVPIGAFGMSLFGIGFSYLDFPSAQMGVQSAWEYVFQTSNLTQLKVCLYLLFVGVSASFFIIPLNAFVQSRAPDERRSRIIAANNILNAVFMVASAIFTMVLYAKGFKTTEVLAVFFVMNAVVTLYIFSVVPEFMFRLGFWLISFFVYKINYKNSDEIPRFGPVVLIGNHVSFIDWFVVIAACKRPVRFVMDHKIYKNPILHVFFRLCKAIPIASAKEDAVCKKKALESISAALVDGDVVCIFPEGAVTRNGEMAMFRPGVLEILETNPTPVVPFAINGLWGSYFSRASGKAMQGMPKMKIRGREVNVDMGKILPAEATLEQMQSAVRQKQTF